MSTRVHAIIPLPPPLNGMTLASAKVVDSLPAQSLVWGIRNTSEVRPIVWKALRHIITFNLIFKAGLRSFRRDNVYFVPSAGAGLWANFAHAFFLKMFFKQVWLHHHVFSYCTRFDWRMSVMLKVLGKSARHIVLGESMRDLLIINYKVTRCVTLNNAILVDPITKIKPLSQQPRRIGFLSNLSLEKGLDTALELMRKIATGFPDMEFIIAGPTESTELSDMIAEFVREAPDHRTYLGKVDSREKEAFFNSIDVMIFPSRYANEAQPLTIYEAMSYGCPVIGTDLGCIPEQLAQTKTYFSVGKFAQSAEELLSSWRKDTIAFESNCQTAFTSFKEHRAQAKLQLKQLTDNLTGDI